MDVSDEEEGKWTPLAASMSGSRSSLSIFDEDILLSILSYVADVPLEMMGTAGEKKTAPVRFESLSQRWQCPLQPFHPKTMHLVFANPI